ncbi:MAG TPA: phenylacetate-CoA oxygenase subunit PaaJ [Chitinophagaceae bacterium]|jgi:ring-1,2-phenylacetyl-CoA epoxidase subunit PaaD|nr:phenylacetate-CoA oxygenase subunit PaaJ [Chitinophagaceae bacterium]HMX77878.1 phenylacetate-CoA oxygenase subunit PaaJ [Chitinophagaceae bacterium]HNA91983.1 phenylacetate-CoA oxygenase subunit PaaJ [Chitinophagaceae bacterium]HNF47653.1 phenylacetate-CoA oxygenase subunit PaaJ [Chitinophagaceae bacterium]HNJ27267.1 phenylacetate-CoA oxygenase subunit PaaJ [Chitinophagaceae bacterium]
MNTATFDKTTIYTYLQEICDPEIPVLSIVDLGMIRDAKMVDDVLEIIITPTYTGCPAVDMIAATIKMDLQSRGFQKVNVTQAISPAWTTDWMTETGKQKLKAYGIAPPNPKQQVCKQELFVQDEAVQCPRCDSWHTHRISEFGSTACKALYQCEDCMEPFDYFKCH